MESQSLYCCRKLLELLPCHYAHIHLRKGSVSDRSEKISPGGDLAQRSWVDLLGIVSSVKPSYELQKCVAGAGDFGTASVTSASGLPIN